MAGRKRAAQNDYDSDDGFVEDAPTKSKRAKPAPKVGDQQTDDSGDPYWELSHNRRVTVNKFGGKMMVNIREYYEKDGKTLPGKKGISLTVEHYAALIQALPGVEKALHEKGESVPRPSYDGQAKSAETEETTDGDIKDEPDNKKMNFEATSDEGED